MSKGCFRTDLRRLAFMSQLAAVSMIVPAPFMLILGPFFLWMLCYAFLGGRWTLLFIGIDAAVDLPQYITTSSAGAASAITIANSVSPVTAIAASLNVYEMLGLLALLLVLDGFYVWRIFVGCWRTVTNIRMRVPKSAFQGRERMVSHTEKQPESTVAHPDWKVPEAEQRKV